MKIAPASFNRCAARAFSTMHLALGYSEPLPLEVESNIKSDQTAAIIGKLFPKHHVLLCCHPDIIKDVQLAENVEYVGPIIYQDTDRYLWSFCFLESDEVDCLAHWVIGAPVFGWKGIRVHMVVAVELSETS